ncbi:RagB/SusD family nutrient uptake outer membrane protein [Flammeovirgaceae bacterium SG7u.111]|nr:RagB/SusD family nutrient uptake outer membrane protein [Flammeovirgaceae bacterium SG7u.132]WPO38261.1 RagB/SusD family nutrient uptake outer membrane protein [Flammeovirgaceae bacterium SG7u.111]
MKKFNIFIKLFLLGALTCASFTGCETLDEDPKGAVTAATYYADPLSLEAGVIGIYGTMHRASWGVDILAAYTGADDLTSHDQGNKWVFLEGDQFNKTGGNQRTIGIWNGYFQAIHAANAFIENANPEGVEEDVLNKFKADAHFVRALLYFRLTTIFGDIPMPIDPVPDFEMTKTSSREVIAQVISDLEFTEQWAVNERDSNTDMQDGHSSKTAAKAFLAKAYMQLTGYPYNEADKWTQVKKYTKEIIDAGVYGLMEDYIHNFAQPWEGNKELIFSHQFDKQPWPILTQGRWYGFFWRDWMDMYIEWDFYDNYPEGYRKAATMSSTNEFALAWEHPVLTKLTYGTINGTPEFEHVWQTSNDMPAMRYAEVLLMYAEACANTGENAEAIEALNKVKRRAYAKGSTTSEEVALLPEGYWAVPDPAIDYTAADLNTPEKIIDAIVKERSYEFVAEVGGNRWLDLVRLEKVAEANQDRSRELPILGDPSDKSTWYAPIPETEIDLNPNLGQ